MTANGDNSSVRYRIRALNGPLRDAVFDSTARLTIGRGCDCDMQVVHNGVSRQHACIEVDEHGNHILVDLESTNGVFVDKKRRRRIQLEPGMVFEIMRYCFVFEVDDAANGLPEESAVPRLAGSPTARTTISYTAFKGPPAPAAKPAAKTDDDADEETFRIERPRPRATVAGPPRYQGDIVGDIADYRALRTRILRGEEQTPPMQALFRRLEHRMRSVDGAMPGSSTRWSYRRFPCRIDATVRLFTGDELPVQLIDVGVDGAKVAVASHSLTPDTLVWLAVARERNGEPRTLVFPGRAVWVRARHIGVSFSGAPGWSLRSRAEGVDRTLRELPSYNAPDNTAVINLEGPEDNAARHLSVI